MSQKLGRLSAAFPYTGVRLIEAENTAPRALATERPSVREGVGIIG